MAERHDQRYKKVFSNPIFVEKLLKSFVHEKFVEGLDFNRMTKIDKSFIDKLMVEKESDLIYEIYFKDKPIYIYLLMEFQSSVDRTMPLRFLRYILELSETYGKNKESKLYPAVFPLLIYNGDENWTAKKDTKELYEKTIPPKFIPSFEYYPIIINKLSRKSLLKIHNAVSAIFFIENIDSNEFSDAVNELIVVLEDVSPSEMKSFKIWFNSLLRDRSIIIPEDQLEKLDKPKEVLPMFAASLERLEKTFVQQGIEKGVTQIAITLLKDGADLDFISRITGLTIEELKKLRV